MTLYNGWERQPDWRADLLEDLPESRIEVRAHTFPSAYDLIKVAAYNRRLDPKDFIGRAALAFAVFDAGKTLTWRAATRREPVMRDIRLHNIPKRRHFGRDFGRWEIEGLK